MLQAERYPSGYERALVVGVAVMMAATILAIFWIAPTEATMGDVQRIMYVHVSVAWLALVGMVVAAATGMVYLVRRDMAWDQWSQSAAELGWLCATLTLVTGSIWASKAWNTWWTWDPRLTTALILWAIYCGILLVRASLEEPEHRARISAVLAIVGLADVPMIVMATRWFRGIHPVSPELQVPMRVVLATSALAFATFFGVLFVLRRRQLGLEGLICILEQQIGLDEVED